MGNLNGEFVGEVARKLEPIFQFTGHCWGNSEGCPSASEIQSAIYELWESAQKYGLPTGTGGIWLDADGDEIVISYRQEIEFHFCDGKTQMA